ncbi:aerolysin family beta-barrel pore-forming toxin [Bailinhaonella thermotolerans]|uniref:aerolysin family beta-barrel pore-forming toxin n=1 Tax=Bailinhaonella thermotolerans TaxID=1070861 RepID=UPI00192A3F9C|nr:aerolysin family beta-barrel pore-forming toxin [Bailinhaonella thermotolerans]
MEPTAFSAANYEGTGMVLSPGRYPPGRLQPYAGKDVRSIRIPAGYEVTFCESADFGGRRRTLVADTPDLGDFAGVASSLVVEAARPPSLAQDARGDHVIRDVRDVEDMKFRVASDPGLIHALADLADLLGYGWCGGTHYGKVGRGFDVTRVTPTLVTPAPEGVGAEPYYLVQARYNKDDPYVQGPMEEDRLKIYLYGFRVLIDPSSLTYGKALLQDMEPTAISSYVPENHHGKDDSATIAFEYQLATTVTHTTSLTLTEGAKVTVGATWGAGALFTKAEFSVGFEVSFAAEEGWSDSTATTHTDWLKHQYTTVLPAKSKRLVTLVASRTRAEVPYTAQAVVGFDVMFEGFLRWGGNARSDHPKDRPRHRAAFGTRRFTGFQHIVDLYEHRHIAGYSEWDWAWAENAGKDRLDRILKFLRGNVLMPVSGKFAGVRGTSVSIVSAEPVPLSTPLTPPPPDKTVGTGKPAGQPAGQPTGQPTGQPVTDPRVWEALPLGTPAADIAVAGNGAAWAVARDGGLYRREPGGGAWARIPEVRANRVAADAAGNAWIVNQGGGVNRVVRQEHAGAVSYGVLPPGDGPTPPLSDAVDIAAGPDGAVWIIAGAETGGNRPVKRWAQSAWEDAGGAAVAISVAPDGVPWITDAQGTLSALLGGTWATKGAGASDLAWSPAQPPTLWAVGSDSGAPAVRRWTDSGWDPAPAGPAIRVATSHDGLPWRIDPTGEIHRLLRP